MAKSLSSVLTDFVQTSNIHPHLTSEDDSVAADLFEELFEADGSLSPRFFARVFTQKELSASRSDFLSHKVQPVLYARAGFKSTVLWILQTFGIVDETVYQKVLPDSGFRGDRFLYQIAYSGKDPVSAVKRLIPPCNSWCVNDFTSGFLRKWLRYSDVEYRPYGALTPQTGETRETREIINTFTGFPAALGFFDEEGDLIASEIESGLRQKLLGDHTARFEEWIYDALVSPTSISETFFAFNCTGFRKSSYYESGPDCHETVSGFMQNIGRYLFGTHYGHSSLSFSPIVLGEPSGYEISEIPFDRKQFFFVIHDVREKTVGRRFLTFLRDAMVRRARVVIVGTQFSDATKLELQKEGGIVCDVHERIDPALLNRTNAKAWFTFMDKKFTDESENPMEVKSSEPMATAAVSISVAAPPTAVQPAVVIQELIATPAPKPSLEIIPVSISPDLKFELRPSNYAIYQFIVQGSSCLLCGIPLEEFLQRKVGPTEREFICVCSKCTEVPIPEWCTQIRKASAELIGYISGSATKNRQKKS